MEEKEKFEWNSRFDEVIKDNQTGDIVNTVEVLNKQDKRIKELEEENLSLQEQSIRDNQNWIEETTKLKQHLYDLPKKIMEEISKELKSLYKNYPIIYSEDKDIVKSCYDKDSVNKILDTILKKYGEKYE